jgi:hypothetical protein
LIDWNVFINFKTNLKRAEAMAFLALKSFQLIHVLSEFPNQ